MLVQCPVLNSWWQRSCYDIYSTEKESRAPFQYKEANSLVQFKQCPLPWVYRTEEELSSSAKWGHHAWYGGGGYSAELGYEEKTAHSIVDLLKLENWVDRPTRAVIVEFTLYNPTINTLSVCSFFFELLQTGQATTLKHIDTISLYNTESILQVFQGLCLVIFIAMVFYKIVEAVTTLIRQGWRCLCSVWYWLDLAHLTSSVLLLVFSFFKSYHTTKTAQNLQRNIFAVVNFQTAVLWADLENCMLAILTFLTTVKLLQLTYFNMYTRVFSHALRIWMRDLFSFLVVLSVLFFAFLLTGILVFGSRVGRYSSFWPAFSFQLEIVLGKVKARPIKELTEANSIIGHPFVSLLLMGITIIMMNFFISTLNDAVNDAKTMVVKKERKLETRENQGDNQTSHRDPKGKRSKKEKQDSFMVERSKLFFDQISNQLKTIDVIQHMPQIYILDKKLTEVLKRIDEAYKNDGNSDTFTGQ